MIMKKTKNTVVHVRVYDDLKTKVEAILEENGMSLSEAINVFLKQIERYHGIPFKIRSEKRKAFPLTKLAIALNETGGKSVDGYAKKILNLYEKGLLDYETAQQALSVNR
jgi:addiction module RelB/DinJ family antitoxin